MWKMNYFTKYFIVSCVSPAVTARKHAYTRTRSEGMLLNLNYMLWQTWKHSERANACFVVSLYRHLTRRSFPLPFFSPLLCFFLWNCKKQKQNKKPSTLTTTCLTLTVWLYDTSHLLFLVFFCFMFTGGLQTNFKRCVLPRTVSECGEAALANNLNFQHRAQNVSWCHPLCFVWPTVQNQKILSLASHETKRYSEARQLRSWNLFLLEWLNDCHKSSHLHFCWSWILFNTRVNDFASKGDPCQQSLPFQKMKFINHIFSSVENWKAFSLRNWE